MTSGSEWEEGHSANLDSLEGGLAREGQTARKAGVDGRHSRAAVHIHKVEDGHTSLGVELRPAQLLSDEHRNSETRPVAGIRRVRIKSKVKEQHQRTADNWKEQAIELWPFCIGEEKNCPAYRLFWRVALEHGGVHVHVGPIGSWRHAGLPCLVRMRELELNFIQSKLPPFRGPLLMRRGLSGLGDGRRSCESRHAVIERSSRTDRTGRAFDATAMTRIIP